MWNGENEENRDVGPEPDSAGESAPLAVELEAAPEPESALELESAPEPESPAEPESAPSLVDGEDHSVDPKSVFVNRVTTLPWVGAVALVAMVVISTGWALGVIPTWLYLWLWGGWLVVVGALTFVGYTWPALHHKHLCYRVDETGVRIKRGVLWRKIISIPNSRVQHTDVSQGPLQRRYNIATLTVHTAGTEGASIHLGGLRHDVALRLRDHLLPTGDQHAD